MALKIAAYRGRSFVSKAIQWQTRSKYSHIGIMLPDDSIIEAWHKGGVLHNAALFTRHSKGTVVDIYKVNASYDEEKVITFLKNQLGKKYDFSSVFRFVSRRKAVVDDKWFCSELAHAAFSKGGLDLLHANISALSPRDTVMSPYLQLVNTSKNIADE